MTNAQFEALKQPFATNEVQWRLTLTTQNSYGLSGLAVPYLDSRAIQRRLDEVVGFDNWQNVFQVVTTGKNEEPTAHICTISIYNEQRNEWISKSNGAGNTDIEAIKGGMSDALKRAASMWNIGRYLYEFEGVWVKVEQRGKSKVIAKGEQVKLDAKYNETVNKLFSKQAQNQPNLQQFPVQNIQQNCQFPPMQPQAKVTQFPPQQNAPFYTIKDANLNKDFTRIVLTNSSGQDITAFYKGAAKVAKNQRLVNVALETKQSPSGDYFVLNDFQIAA